VKREPSKPAGIKEIAEALNVSIGTVDRALHARSGVSAQTRALVLETARKLNYRPNIAARSLKLNRNIRIAVHLPSELAGFYGPVREGIRAAALASPGMRVDLDFTTYPRFGLEDVHKLEKDLERGYDGFILAPGSPRKLDPVLRKIAASGGHSLFVATDAPRCPRLAFVGSDAFVCGSIAAELLSMRLTHDGSVAVITGDLGIEDHAEKLRGFASTIAVMGSHLRLMPSIESHDDPRQAYKQTMALLSKTPRPKGIYISTANSLGVLQAIEEQGLLGKIQVVTTDLFRELLPLIESGGVFATLHQRPFTQGKVAFETLAQFLVYGIEANTVTKLAPHIVLRSNLKLFPSESLFSTANPLQARHALQAGPGDDA
jgi:LacI family transcriptional regulator